MEQIEINVTKNIEEVEINVQPNVTQVIINEVNGGGGVKSVTGNIVDNTDPLNPVVDFTAGDYDLEDFTNTSADPFVRESDLPSPTVPTLQEVLDNNRDLVDGVFNAGTGAGQGNTGENQNALGEAAGQGNTGNNQNAIGRKAGFDNTGDNQNALGANAGFFNTGDNQNALGTNAGASNTGDNQNALGDSAGANNAGDNVNALGENAGANNTFNNVNLFGQNAQAEDNGETVLSKDGKIMARISTTDLTATRKYTLPNASGTLALTGDLSSFVPYTGATQNVNLGEFGADAGFIKLDTTPTGTPTGQGTMAWDVDNETISVILNGYKMLIGEDQFYPVKNQTGSTINKGTNVKFAGTVGASGRLLIAPFLADGTDPSYVYMGVAAENILNGQDGKVLWFGRLRGINTNAFEEGDILYASTSSAGGFQTAIPTGSNNVVQVAAVINKSSTQGVIFIRPQIEPLLVKPENVANKATNLTSPDNTKYPTTQAVANYVAPVASTSADIDFTVLKVFGSVGTPLTANLTNTLTGALTGLVQKIYHNNATAPTVPAGWVLIGGEYVVSELNIIYAEFVESSRVEYWIVQEI